MKCFSAALCLITVALIAGDAKAQCPAGVTPLNFLSGKTWAFQTDDYFVSGAIGIFTASIGTSRGTGPQPIGLLNITQTSNNGGNLLSQANFAGGYTVAADCSGGSLTFNQGGNGHIFDFVFVKDSTEMLFLDQNTLPTTLVHGRAKLLPAVPSCPAGNPLNVLNGTNWGFETENIGGSYLGSFSASVGTSARGGGATIGSLSVVESFTGAPVINQDSVGGSFLVNPDCSGGQLIFGTSGEATMGGGMYAFVFASPTQMYLIANNGGVPSALTSNIFFGATFGDAFVK